VLSQDEAVVNRADDFRRFLIHRNKILDGVVISGGEPLLQKDIIAFIKEIKDMGLKVKIDTNGSMPSTLERIIVENLVDYIALDFKNEQSLIDKTCGISNAKVIINYVEQWHQSVAILRKSRIDYELRTTVVKELHSLKTLMEMAKCLHEDEKWYIQSFYKSSKILNDYHNEAEDIMPLSSYSKEELLDIVNSLKSIHDQTIIR